MKKLIIFLLFVPVFVFGQNKTITIPSGSSFGDVTFASSDSIQKSTNYWVLVNCAQDFPQMQDLRVHAHKIRGQGTVTVTLQGRLFSTSSWSTISSAVTWYLSAADTTISITNATPNKYRAYKLLYASNSETQATLPITFELKTWFTGGSISGASITDGVATITSGAASGLTTVAASGRITGTGGATITGAATNINASSNFATNIGTGSTNAAVTIGGGSNTVAINSTALDISTTGAITGATTINASGVITATGGLALATQPSVYWAAGGSTVLATSGTDVSCANGNRFWVELNIPYNTTLTGIAYLVGSVGGTDSVVVQLFNSAGTEVANTRVGGLAGAAALVGTAAQFQSVAFSTPYAAVAGRYFVALQFNGTTAKFRAYPIPGSKFITGTAAGTWGTAANITPGTSFTADKGAILMTY